MSSLPRQKAALLLAIVVILLVSALAFVSTQQLIALSGQVEQRQERISASGAAIASTQGSTYRAERERLARQAWLTSVAMAMGVIFCLSVIGWLFALRGREFARRQLLEDELRGLNAQLEERVEQRSAEVQRANGLLKAVVENLPDMIMLKEPAGDRFRYLLVNAAGEKLLGRSRSDILGKTESDLFPPDEAAAYVQSNRIAFESGEARIFPTVGSQRPMAFGWLKRASFQSPTGIAVLSCCWPSFAT